ncbi:Uncharacterised protein [Klebsiella pneumoniae]|nr:Uncharacterised protein [Klebsiella pneumoniae]
MTQRAVKKTAVLPDIAYGRTPVRRINLGCINFINEYLPAALLIQARHHPQQGRLPAADPAQNRNLLTGFNIDIDILENARGYHHSRHWIGEPHFVQAHAAREIRRW